ncbi:NUDIX domain-containing protein [Nakamurella sp. A5-74]|uniref:NUDIX domain-containing protein n=1 Tax=Nakamurella sp. A5-74 TaxID=3158264 RepID=A0AAU8DUP9_9ACTN
MAAIRRRTARVIPVSPAGRVLMVLGHDPLYPDAPYWFTIGGGLEPGESEKQAARRELWEETGIDRPAADLGEPFLRDEHSYVYNGVEVHANSVFFALALHEDVDVRPPAPSPGEIITDGRWWYPEALTREPLSNPDLPEIVARAVGSL